MRRVWIFIFLVALNNLPGLSARGVNQVNDTLILTLDTVIMLKGVEIYQQKRPVKLSGALSGKMRLDTEQMQRLPSFLGNADLLKGLELTPSLSTAGDVNANIYVRGGDTGQNSIMLGQNRIYSPGHVFNIFSLFNSDHVSTAELLLSGVEGQYGDYISSIIQFDPCYSLPKKSSLKGSAGIISSQATLALPLGPKFGLYLSGRLSYLDLLVLPLIRSSSKTGSGLGDLNYDIYDTNFTFIAEFDRRNKMLVNLFLSGDKLDIKDDEIALDAKLNWKNWALSAELVSQISPVLKLSQSLNYSKFSNRLNAFQAKMDLGILSSIEDGSYKALFDLDLRNLNLSTGIQYHHYKVCPYALSMYNFDHEFNREYIGDNKSNMYSLFTTAKFHIGNRFFVTPSLRFTHFTTKIAAQESRKNFNSLDTRLALRYQLRHNLFVTASYSLNHQYVHKLTPSSVGLPTDYWVTASGMVRPQKGLNLSLGAYLLIDGGDYELSLDGYYRHMHNITEYNQSFIDSEVNLFTESIKYGSGRAYGIELMLRKNRGRLTGWLSYALARSERQVNGVNNNRYYPSKHDRTHNLNIVASYEASKYIDLSASFVFATGTTYTQPSSWYFINSVPVKQYDEYNGARMPDYNRLDFSLDYTISKRHALNLSLHNLFMKKNPIYVFLLIDENTETEELEINIKQKTAFTLIPSISWRFNF